MNPYEGGKVYGPYIRKEDNRSHVIIIFENIKQTVSYPKFLMEIKLGRYLNEDEEVHHKDGNVANNSEDNLVVLNRTIHRSLSIKNVEEVLICAFCKMPFIASAKYMTRRKANIKRGKAKTGPFCSRKCQGKVNN